MQQVLGIMYNALLQDEDCQVLELCKKAGLDFVQTIYRSGSMTCIRDECLGGNYGIKVIKKFIDMGVDMNEAVVKGRTPANIVASLQKRTMFSREKDDYFEKAAEFFSKESMEQLDNNGTSAIHYAAKNEHLEMLQVMIDKGVDVNHADNDGNTALILNAKNNCYKGVIKELIKAGADVNAYDKLGNSALYYALKYGDLESSRFMIKKGADFNHANNEGVTPMEVAVENGYDSIIELMYE